MFNNAQEMATSPERLWTVEEVAQYLRLKPATIRRIPHSAPLAQVFKQFTAKFRILNAFLSLGYRLHEFSRIGE